jgi:Golgi phosphoprotein 3 (GPP34)
MLLTEDLLLLLTDDATGKLDASSTQVDVALGGAQLVDLVLARRIEITAAGRLLVIDRSPTGDELLDEALAVVDLRQGRRPKDVVRSLGHVRTRLYERLAADEILREDAGRILGILPRHRWPTVRAEHENAVRAAALHSLRVGDAADVRTGALIALLHALDAVAKVFDPADAGLERDAMEANAERIGKGDWASDAVRAAIRELMGAIVAATASTAAAAGS